MCKLDAIDQHYGLSMESPVAKVRQRRRRASRPPLDPVRIKALRDKLAAEGKTVASLAADMGEDAYQLYKVLSGQRAASFGAAHRIATRLGLKDGSVPAAESASQ